MAPKKKIIKKEIEIKETCCSGNCCSKEELVLLLKRNLPKMFDREPNLTGDVNKLADEIINLLK